MLATFAVSSTDDNFCWMILENFVGRGNGNDTFYPAKCFFFHHRPKLMLSCLNYDKARREVCGRVLKEFTCDMTATQLQHDCDITAT